MFHVVASFFPWSSNRSSCISSPFQIMLTTGALWLHVEPMTALCLLVELNTLFLTLKNLKRAPTVQQVNLLLQRLS
jgi:hypothetical protein